MKAKKRFGLTLGALCVGVGVLAFATVAATAAESGEAGHGYRWGDFGWRVANFIIFFGALWYFVGGMAKKYFKGRKEDIRQSLDDLETRRETAMAQLADVEKRIATLDAERTAILEESRAQADMLQQAIVDEAKRQAELIVKQAQSTAENEARAVVAQVRATLADEIVNATEKALRGKLGAAEHEKLIANSLEKVVLQ